MNLEEYANCDGRELAHPVRRKLVSANEVRNAALAPMKINDSSQLKPVLLAPQVLSATSITLWRLKLLLVAHALMCPPAT
ncbi:MULTISPECIES: hypothetical protein [unclassified Bradyrhizobium]